MPTYDRAICNLIIDYPEVDGKKTSWGIGRDWVAAEPKILGRRTPDIAGQYGWDYDKGEFEYIVPLKAIAPKGKALFLDVNPAGYDVIRGKWQVSPVTGKHMGRQWLQFYDGRPGLLAAGEWGYIMTKAAIDPVIHLVAWMMPPAEDETDPTLLEIVFEGDGSHPYYKVGVPRRVTSQAASGGMGDEDPGRHTCPYLLGAPIGSGFKWVLVDEFRGGGGSGIPAEDGQEARFESIRLEYTEDGWLLVNFASSDTTWAYSGKWKDEDGEEHEFRLTPGKIGIAVCGQTLDFNLNLLEYGTDLELKPSLFFHTLVGTYNQTRTYRQIRTINTGVTDIVGTYETPTAGVSRPILTFSTTDVCQRAIFYRVQEYRDPTFGGASTVPIDTQDNPNLKLLRASGHLNDDWRGLRLEAEVKALRDLVMIQPAVNSKVRAYVSCNDGLTYHIQFTGYALEPESDRIPETGLVEGRFEAADGIDARLIRHKVGHECSLSEWPIPDAYRHLLNQGGVPLGMIFVDPSINPNPEIEGGMGTNYYLPAADPKGEAHLQFRPEDNLPAALDTICRIRGLEHGYNPFAGHYFIRKPLVHVPGYSDLTLDEDSIGAEDLILSFRAMRTAADYFNVLHVMIGEGWSAKAKLFVDLASIAGLADDWSEWVYEPDADDIELLARRLWNERKQLQDVIYWRTAHYPGLNPDNYVEVDEVSNVALLPGTIFKVVTKNWSVENGKFIQELEGRIVEEPP